MTNKLLYLDILYELYAAKLANGRGATFMLIRNHKAADAADEDEDDILERDDNIDLALFEDNTQTQTQTSTPIRSSTPSMAYQAIQRKRKRGKDGESSLPASTKLKVSSASSINALAESILAIAHKRVADRKTDCSDAIAILVEEFNVPPRKLSLEHIQKALDFLMIPKNATNFISLCRVPISTSVRDRWLERRAGITIIED